ncbi:hypothetical protein ERO13_A08G184366v2 [Gossypium hirsutum]|nr:hypothetical protein ERO13_A08G184366v2 [Gossypium hirsutum]
MKEVCCCLNYIHGSLENEERCSQPSPLALPVTFTAIPNY